MTADLGLVPSKTRERGFRNRIKTCLGRGQFVFRSAQNCTLGTPGTHSTVRMRASRWLVAVATVPHGRNTCASPGVLAFVNYAPGTRRTLLSSAAHSTTTISVSSLRSGSSNSALLNRPSLSPCRPMMMSTSGGGGGESWCGHELLNTVTTDWVKDHLHDPEVGVPRESTLNKTCAHVLRNWRDCHVLHRYCC